MPLINTLGALVSAKNVIGTVPTGLGYVASSADFDAINYSGTSVSPSSVISSTVLTDASGNVYIPYRRPASSGLGDNSLGLVAKLSPTGFQLVGAGAVDPRTISGSRVPVNFFGTAIDSTGNIYSAGLGTRIVGSNAYQQILVTKSDLTGQLDWSYVFYTDTTAQIAIDIKIDASDNVYVLSNNSTLIKLDTNGTLIWGRNIGGTVRAMALDASGNIIILSTSVSVSVITKINSSGTSVWSVNINTNTATDIAWLNNIIYVGTTNGVITFNDSGTLLNQISFGVTLTTARIAADTSGNIYFGGVTGAREVYIASVNSSLALRWKNIIYINPTITYPDGPYLSGIGIDGTSMIVVFNHYSDSLSGGEIRSMYALKVPTNGKILMRGRYVLSDNVVYYIPTTAGSISTTAFTTSSGGGISTATLTRASVPLQVASPVDWYDMII